MKNVNEDVIKRTPNTNNVNKDVMKRPTNTKHMNEGNTGCTMFYKITQVLSG